MTSLLRSGHVRYSGIIQAGCVSGGGKDTGKVNGSAAAGTQATRFGRRLKSWR